MSKTHHDMIISAENNTQATFKQINADAKRTATNLGRMFDTGTRQGRNMRQNIQQLGYQVQDFTVQVSNGTSFLTAFGQQGSQLASIFGARGALVGAMIAIGSAVAGAFLPALFKSSKATEDLNEKLKDLIETANLTEAQSKVLVQAEQDKIKSKEKALAKLKEELKILEIQKANQQFILDKYDEESEVYKNIAKARVKTNQGIAEQTSQMQLLNGEIEEHNKRIKVYQTFVGDDNPTKKQREEIDSTISALKDQLETLGLSERELEIYNLRKLKATDAEIKQANAIFDNIEAKLEQAELEKEQQALELSREKTLESVTNSLKAQIVTLEQGKEAAMAFSIAQRLGVDSVNELPESIQLLIDKLNALQEAQNNKTFWESFKEQVQNSANDFDLIWGNTFNQFATGIGDATASAIMEGQNFSDTMRTFARSTVQEVISGLIKIGVQRLVLSNIESFITAKNTAETIGATTTIAATTASAMAAPAAATSLATAGTNSAPAISGMTMAMAAAAGLFALSSFDGGGYTGDGARVGGMDGKGGRLAMIHPRETIIDHTKSNGMQPISISAPITINGSVDDDTIRALERNQKRFARMVQSVMGKPI